MLGKGFLKGEEAPAAGGDGGPRGRSTIHDVAALSGVSIATASKALNGGGRMRDETRERVQRAARDLGFRPNALARSLLSQRSFTVGLLTDDTYGRFTLPVMTGLTEGLIDQGVSVFLCGIEGNPDLGRLHVDAMLDKRVEGIVATGKRVDRRLPVDLGDLPVPVIHVLSEGPAGAVTLLPDEEQGAGLAVAHLLGQGRRRVLHVTGPESFRVARQRARAYAATLAAAGLEPPAPMYGRWSEGWGHEAVAAAWGQGAARGPAPDAIFCGNDQIARGVVDALRERGVRVPEDVAVVGFDNWEVVAREARPPLTSVDMNLKELGRQAGLTLLSMIAGADVAPGIRALPCTLRVRRSSGGGPG